MRRSSDLSGPGPPDGGSTPNGQNALLSGLHSEELDLFNDSLELILLGVEDRVFEPDTAIEHLYFPTSGVLSLLARDDADGMIEVGTIGNEGMAGLAVFHNADSSPHRCFCQIAGTAKRISANTFKHALPAMPQLQDRLLRYSQCFFNDVAQSVACNSLHSVEQRCARWLLMTHDRVGGQGFELKQSFLSFMLAASRNAVSAAASAHARRGLIRYSRGRIDILNREGLEKVSCSCYRITRKAYDELLGGI
jgi:CRP-like cAMP-binding protein